MSQPRNSHGASLAEFGPALFILFVCIFFPLIDLVALSVNYCTCTSLNSLQTQKAAEVTKDVAVDAEGPVRKELVKAWEHTGMGAFVKLAADPTTDVTYENADDRDQYVNVTTNFSVSPLIVVPFLPGVPGLSAPASFRVSSKRLVEDPNH